MDPLTAATLGVVLLGETVRLSPLHVVLGVIGVVLTAAGLTVLSRTAHQVTPAIAEPVLLIGTSEPHDGSDDQGKREYQA